MKSQKWMLIVGIIAGVSGIGFLSTAEWLPGILLTLAGAALLVLFFVLPKPEPKPKKEPKPKEEPKPKAAPVQNDGEQFEFKVAGVSYRNDDGTERQDIIKSIKAGRKVRIEIRPYKYNGHPAFGVYADGQQLGSVPSDLVDDITDVWNDRYTVTDYKVLGSGKDAPHGFLIKVKF